MRFSYDFFVFEVTVVSEDITEVLCRQHESLCEHAQKPYRPQKATICTTIAQNCDQKYIVLLIFCGLRGQNGIPYLQTESLVSPEVEKLVLEHYKR